MFLKTFNIHEKLHVFTKNKAGLSQSINQQVIKAFGLKTADDFLGRSDFDLPGQEKYAPSWIENDCRVMARKEAEILLESANCGGQIQWFRSYKAPLIGQKGNVIGILGVCQPIHESSLIPLAPQQIACLKYLAMGMTHKQIGIVLGLSPKTVEHYLDAVKIKLNCKSRTELMIQAFERGLIAPF
jgi:DNA-binding CsgD family transcriptional regulator